MKVIIADDSLIIRRGLSQLLEGAGYDVLTVADAEALHREVTLGRPDAVLVDIRMPPGFRDEGIRAAQHLRASQPRLGVLVLSQYLEAAWAVRLMDESPGHLGYLLKDRVDDLDVLVDALTRVIAGECVVDRVIVSGLLRRQQSGPVASLTDREREVLGLMAEGRSNAAIAARLVLSPKTLEVHIRHILQRLGLTESPDDHRRVLAVLAYLRSTDQTS